MGAQRLKERFEIENQLKAIASISNDWRNQ
jgi:hypothetical protein